MSFAVSAAAYDQFMGRYSEPLATGLVTLIGPTPGQHVLDVGCGPGALTAQLVSRLGAEAVSAIDPSEQFVSAARTRLPGVDIRLAAAEAIPFADNRFDLVLAQLVVHFMGDPVAGIAEMTRVARPGGQVAASVWDFGGDRAPLSTFWRAARELDPAAPGEAQLPGAREDDLAGLFEQAGVRGIDAGELAVRVAYPSLAEWWLPYTLGVGPAGAYVAGLAPGPLEALRARCAELLPAGPFEIEAVAWTAIGRA